MRFINDMSIRVKVGILVAFAVVGLIYLGYASVNASYTASSEAARMQDLRQFVDLATATGDLVHRLQIERGRSAGYLASTDAAPPAELTTARANTDAARTKWNQLLTSESVRTLLGKYPAVSDAVRSAESPVEQLPTDRKAVDARKLTVAEEIETYTDTITGLLKTVAILQISVTDPVINNHLTAYHAFLQEKERNGIERASINATLTAKALPIDRFRLIAQVIQAEKVFHDQFMAAATPEQLKFYGDTVTGDDTARAEAIKTMVLAYDPLAAVKEDDGAGGPAAAESPLFQVQADEWFKAITAKIDLMKQVEDQIAADITAIAASKESAARSSVTLSLAFVALAVLIVLLTAYISWIITAGITRQTDAIMSMLSEIGMGDFSARAPIVGEDELGNVATSLNTMLDNTLSLIQSQSERDQIQTSIQRLIEELTRVAAGDLTVEAEISKDVTGSVAESFNVMIKQLREIVSNVQDATLQVSSSANQIQTTTEHLSRGSEAQSAQIVDTSAALDEMAVSIQQVAENTATSATVADQARANALRGTKAVRQSSQAMERIRKQVQETAKRIKRLGESSQEIGEIVQLISDIADRTSILALNASIQAAAAGDAGKGFAVVAEEVERLAERSNNATKQIAGLIKTIQGEIAEAVTAMEHGTQEVVDGTRLTQEAGEALKEIDEVSNKLAELMQSISMATKQQARGAEALSKSMSEISEVTQHTAAGTKQAAVSVSTLATLADDLRSSVSTFQLPMNGNGNGHGHPKAAFGRPELARARI